ncbi:MAG: hypothetical protein QHJ73_12465, partial [Armatimonadota bacterium]|nr:hypothetical protein [Armatimonadota bacterium]
MSLLDRINRSRGGGSGAGGRPPSPDAADLARPAPGADGERDTAGLSALVWRVLDRLGDAVGPSGSLDLATDPSEREERMRALESRVAPILDQENIQLTPTERTKLLGRLYDEVYGLGPLEPALEDPTIQRIVVNGPKEVLVERYSGAEQSDLVFRDDAHLVRIIHRVAELLEVPLDAAIPRLSVSLSDGSRVSAVLPPLAAKPTLTIHKMVGNPFRSLKSSKASASSTAVESFYQLKYRLLDRLISQLDQEFLTRTDPALLRRQVQEIILRLLDEQGITLSRAQRNQLVFELQDEVTGLGPLEELLRDPSVTEVMVNGPKQVWYETSGKLYLSTRQFRDEEHL